MSQGDLQQFSFSKAPSPQTPLSQRLSLRTSVWERTPQSLSVNRFQYESDGTQRQN